MTRLPRVTGKDLKNALLKLGFRSVYVRGSHHYLEPIKGGRLVTIHAGKILKPKTLKGILEQSGITVEELIEKL